jgi:hypothetical protein
VTSWTFNFDMHNHRRRRCFRSCTMSAPPVLSSIPMNTFLLLYVGSSLYRACETSTNVKNITSHFAEAMPSIQSTSSFLLGSNDAQGVLKDENSAASQSTAMSKKKVSGNQTLFNYLSTRNHQFDLPTVYLCPPAVPVQFQQPLLGHLAHQRATRS